MSSHRTHTYRHNLVIEAITSTARWYGISVTTEHRCFTYEDKSNKRLDLLFHTQPQGIVTDISLVRTTADLAHEEKSKTEKHSAWKVYILAKPLQTGVLTLSRNVKDDVGSDDEAPQARATER
jgi:hypothetical protein